MNQAFINHQKWLSNQKEGKQLSLENSTFKAEWLKYPLYAAIYQKVIFKNINFIKTDLTGSYFFNCIFEQCQFENSRLHKCEWYDCNLEQTIFSNTLLTKSDFNNCNFKQAHFEVCNLGWTYCNSCDFREVDYNEVSMEGTIIVDTKMYTSKRTKIDFGKKFPAKLQNIDMSVVGDGSEVVGREAVIEYFTMNH